MGIWRPKQEESKSIWFRVPASLKKEFEELRQQAEAEGLDAGTTFTAAKQLREELPRTKTQDHEASRPIKANGLDHREGSRPHRVNAE